MKNEKIMDKFRVLVVDKDISFCRMLSGMFGPYSDIKVDIIYHEEEIVDCLSEIYYNVIIIDRKKVSDEDISAIIRNKPNPERHPIDSEIILTSDEPEADTVYKTKDQKSYYLLKKPLDFAFIEKLLNDKKNFYCIQSKLKRLSNPQKDIKEFISKILNDIGIPHSINGYKYLYFGINAAIENPGLVEYITKGLYPHIAQNFHVSSAKVEKSIRDAINLAWGRGDSEVLREYFGNTVSARSGKPSNSQFIKSIMSKIKLEIPEIATDNIEKNKEV